MKNRFTFADAKQKISDLEQQLEDQAKVLKEKAGNVILNTEDHYFTKKELKRIKKLELWSILAPLIGLFIGYLIFR